MGKIKNEKQRIEETAEMVKGMSAADFQKHLEEMFKESEETENDD